MELTLYLIRHGLTAGNIARRYIGMNTDEPLTERGRRELLERKGRGCYPRADALYTGTLARCEETARLLYPMLVPIPLPAFNELDFGAFEGKTYEQLKNEPAYRQWIDSAGLTPPPGGEGGREFARRLHGGLESLAADARRRGFHTAAVVTHGGCIMTLLSGENTLKNDLYSHQVACGGGYRLLMDIDTLQISGVSPL